MDIKISSEARSGSCYFAPNICSTLPTHRLRVVRNLRPIATVRAEHLPAQHVYLHFAVHNFRGPALISCPKCRTATSSGFNVRYSDVERILFGTAAGVVHSQLRPPNTKHPTRTETRGIDQGRKER